MGSLLTDRDVAAVQAAIADVFDTFATVAAQLVATAYTYNSDGDVLTETETLTSLLVYPQSAREVYRVDRIVRTSGTELDIQMRFMLDAQRLETIGLYDSATQVSAFYEQEFIRFAGKDHEIVKVDDTGHFREKHLVIFVYTKSGTRPAPVRP